jgi:hypothetical protein
MKTPHGAHHVKEIACTCDHGAGEPLGVEMTLDPVNGEILIASVLNGSNGERAGLHQGYQLLTVNGAVVTGKPLAEIARLLAKKSQLTFAAHNFDNPSLWAKMLSRGTYIDYKTRADRRYKKMFMWADCHAGTMCFAPERNAPAKQICVLKATDISEISTSPPDGPEHAAHQKRMDAMHHIRTHAASRKRGGGTADERKIWVASQKKAHKTKQKAGRQNCIELACYHDGFMIYDHTKDLRMIDGGIDGRNEWIDAIEWYHRVCRKHQMDIVVKRFKQIDKDHSGDIDISELKALFPGVKGDQAAKDLFTKFDTNGDGKLSFAEFVPLLAALEGRTAQTPSAQHTAAAAATHHVGGV